MPKEEIITRFNMLHDSISEQLNQRPTKVNLKKIMDETEKKIDKVAQENESQVKKVEQIQTDMNQELKTYNGIISTI